MTRRNNEDHAPDIADLLRAGADDGHQWQPDTDMILRLGRRAVHRRRLAVTATAASGSMIVVAAFALPTLGSGGADDGQASRVASGSELVERTPESDEQPSEPDEQTAEWDDVLQPLSEDEVIELCREQLAEQQPDVPVDTWRRPTEEDGHPVPDDGELYIGDGVSFEAGDTVAFCTIQGTWRPEPPVDLTQEAPAEDDHDAILRACSATIGADLRQWNVAAAMADGVGGLAAMLTSPGDDPYLAACQLQPSTWDAGMGPSLDIWRSRLSEIHADADRTSLANSSASPEGSQTCIKTAHIPCSGSMYASIGVVSQDVASLEYELPDAQTVTVPVEDGLFAFRAVDGIDDGELNAPTVSAYNKDGELIDRIDRAW